MEKRRLIKTTINTKILASLIRGDMLNNMSIGCWIRIPRSPSTIGLNIHQSELDTCGLKGLVHDGLGLLLDLPEMVLSLEAFRIDFVDVLRA